MGKSGGSAARLPAEVRVWWGEAPFRPYDVNEVADVLIPKTLQGRSPAEPEYAVRPRTSAPFDQLYVTISPVPTLM